MATIDEKQPGDQTRDPRSRRAPSDADSLVHRSRGWWVVVPIAICLLSVAGWMRFQASEARSLADQVRAKREGRPIPVRTELVSRRTYERVNGATGVTSASKTAIIRMSTAVSVPVRRVGISAVHIKEGQFVSAGSMLFELDDNLFRLARKQRESACTTAEEELKAIERLQQQGAATGFQFRKAQVALELAQLELEMARRDVQRCKITSPIEGFVDQVVANRGEQIDASQELTTVYTLNPVHMRIDVPQERIAEAKIGQQAEVVLDSFPQETFTGTLIALSPQVDSETRVLSAVLEIPNADYRIKAGISGFARFRSPREGVTVPSTAVIEMDRKAMTFVIEQGVARMREIRTGQPVETGVTEVLEGLQPGEEVVVFGQQYLEDGDPVDVNWRRWARRE